MTITEGMRVKLIRPEHWLAGSPPVGSVGTVHMRGYGSLPAEIVWDHYRGDTAYYFGLASIEGLPSCLKRLETPVMTQHTHGYRDIPAKDRPGIHTGDGKQDVNRRQASFPSAGGGNGVFRHEAGTPGLSEARWWQDIGYLFAWFVTEVMDFPRNLSRRIRYRNRGYFPCRRDGNAVFTAFVLCLAMLLIMAGVFLWMGVMRRATAH